MPIIDFDTFQGYIQEHYQNGDYKAARSLIDNRGDDYPDYQHILNYWRITLTTKIGDLQGALTLLSEILDTGFWYGDALLRNNPALKPLQGLETFEELVTLNQLLQQREFKQIFPVLTLRSEGSCEIGGTPCPLLVGFHNNASMASETLAFWQPAAQNGWMIAAPQSRQALWKGAYNWDDREAAEVQIRDQITKLFDEYAIDLENIVLAGHSMGGDLALWLTLTARIQSAGFLTIGLDGPLIDNLQLLDQIINYDVSHARKGYLVIGDEDNAISPHRINELVKILNQNGIETELDIIPGAGHEFSIEYADGLLRGLEYICN